jgi:hypothetical protein
MDPTEVWETDLARERPPREELQMLYRQYGEEGHLVVFGHVRGDRPLDSWIVWCAGCKATSYGGRAGEIPDELPDLLSYDEAKWWGRGHRTDNGLTWQEWAPSMDIGAVAKRGRS